MMEQGIFLQFRAQHWQLDILLFTFYTKCIFFWYVVLQPFSNFWRFFNLGLVLYTRTDKKKVNGNIFPFLSTTKGWSASTISWSRSAAKTPRVYRILVIPNLWKELERTKDYYTTPPPPSFLQVYLELTKFDRNKRGRAIFFCRNSMCRQ